MNANLSWEVLDFSGLDNWSARLQDNASATLTGRPRRLKLRVESGTDDISRIISDVLTTHDSLGAFRITFKDVSYTEGDVAHMVGIGLRENYDPSDFIQQSAGGDAAIAYNIDSNNDNYFTSTNPYDGAVEQISDIGWGSNHDITIEWDGNDAKLLIDGVLQSSLSHSGNADYRPVIEIKDGANSGGYDVIEVGEVIVEAL